jgi:hypothetical protein
MLTADHAIELAGRGQRRALREAAGFAGLLGEPVGFLRRAVPGGVVFEAVALESARTCAIVDEHGTLRLAPPERSRTRPAERSEGDAVVASAAAAPRFRAGVRQAAEHVLRSAARPGPRDA